MARQGDSLSSFVFSDYGTAREVVSGIRKADRWRRTMSQCTFRKLLPEWAIRTEKLDYGVEFDEPGLYYTVYPNGALHVVGVVALSDPPSWFTDRRTKVVICRSLLRIDPDRASGYSRGVVTGTIYEKSGTLRTANGYTEEDDVRKADISFDKWTRNDIARKIKLAAEMLEKS
jgi:hypothetical protein